VLATDGGAIVTVKLMGNSDLETTRKYLNPDEELKGRAANLLSYDLVVRGVARKTSRAQTVEVLQAPLTGTDS
jgi:hypothetical protein